MKKPIEPIIRVIEIIINICLLPLFNVKFFHDVSVSQVQTETGEFVYQSVDHYYSIMDNIKYDPLLIVPMSIGIILISIIYSSLSFVIKHKNLKHASHIFFACSVVFFLFVVYTASLVQRDY